MDIEDYESDRAEKKLLMKLQEAEEAVKAGEGWLDILIYFNIFLYKRKQVENRLNIGLPTCFAS